MKADKGAAAQVFWQEGKEAFNEGKSVTFPIESKARKKYFINLDSHNLQSIRFDPTDQATTVSIFRIVLRSADGQSYSWDRRNNFSGWKEGSNVELSFTADSLQISARNSDPSIIMTSISEHFSPRWPIYEVSILIILVAGLPLRKVISEEWRALLALPLLRHFPSPAFFAAPCSRVFGLATIIMLCIVVFLNIAGGTLAVPYLQLPPAVVFGSFCTAIALLYFFSRARGIGIIAAYYWKPILIATAVFWLSNLFFLAVSPIFDITISKGAFEFVTKGVPCNAPMDYYPPLSTIYLIYCILFLPARLFGISDFNSAYSVLLVFNTACILLTILFTFKLLLQTCSKDASGIALLLMCSYLPWIIYCTLPYTDTILLFLLPWSFLRFKKAGNKVDGGTFCIMLLLISLKPTYLVFLMAMVMISLQSLSWLHSVSVVVISMACFTAAMWAPPKLLVQITKEPLIPSWETPTWHFINMGQEYPFGAYNGAYVAKTNSLPGPSAKAEYNREQFYKKLKQRGLFGEIGFLLVKLNSIWSDPDLYSLEKMRLTKPGEKAGDKFIKQSILTHFYTHPYLHYATLPQHLLIIISLLIAGCFKWRADPFSQLCLISILFLTVFILFWEGRSRYLMIGTPIMFVLVGQAIEAIRERMGFARSSALQIKSE